MSENTHSQPPIGLSGDRPVIGLAGGIGSGKSTVASMLAELGCVVDNADDAVRTILKEDQVRDVLVSWWGRGILDHQNQVDRSAVARLVFDDPKQRTRLEQLLHPLVLDRRVQEWKKHENNPSIVAFVIDAPLVFEADLDRLCDAIIFIETDEATRQCRVVQNRDWSPDELSRREKNQLPLETKRDRSDYSVINNGTIAGLRDQVQLTLKQILTAHRQRLNGTISRGRANVKPQS